jgi:hypothetical protein
VLVILVRFLLLAFLLFLGVLIIRRTMWALRGARPDKSADETGRSQGQQGSGPWWEVLGVSQDASLEEINEHYRQTMRMYHPDKVAGTAPEIIALAERRTKELNAAFSEAKRVRSTPASKRRTSPVLTCCTGVVSQRRAAPEGAAAALAIGLKRSLLA